mmetsp:Transcript_24865/g.78909  ORF Transcript_24865/g.78909 Transcript_24865/m.78909 type:complete len:481 (+) Transcript_24865:616-2058(+)
MDSSLVRPQSSGGSELEESPDEVPPVVRDDLPVGLGEDDLRLPHEPHGLSVVLADKGRVTADQHVQHDPAGPDVACVVVGHAAGHLGRHVLDLPHRLGEVLAFREPTCHAEVHDLDDAVLYGLRGLQQHVLRSQIPVADFAGVKVAHARQDLHRDGRSLPLGEAVVLQHALEQLPARAELKDQVVVQTVLKHLKQLDDVGVVSLPEDPRDVLEVLQVCSPLVEALHCEGGLGVPVLGLPDAAEVPLYCRDLQRKVVGDLVQIVGGGLRGHDDKVHGELLLQLLHEQSCIATEVVDLNDSVARLHLVGAAPAVPLPDQAIRSDGLDQQSAPVGAIHLHADCPAIGLVNLKLHHVPAALRLPVVLQQRRPADAPRLAHPHGGTVRVPLAAVLCEEPPDKLLVVDLPVAVRVGGVHQQPQPPVVPMVRVDASEDGGELLPGDHAVAVLVEAGEDLHALSVGLVMAGHGRRTRRGRGARGARGA